MKNTLKVTEDELRWREKQRRGARRKGEAGE